MISRRNLVTLSQVFGNWFARVGLFSLCASQHPGGPLSFSENMSSDRLEFYTRWSCQLEVKGSFHGQ